MSTASTCSVHRVRARVCSTTAQRSSPPYSMRGAVFRRGVRRDLGTFAVGCAVPSHQAHGLPTQQGPLHRTPAAPKRQNSNPTRGPRADHAQAWLCVRMPQRRGSDYALAPLCSSTSPGPKARSSTWPMQVPPIHIYIYSYIDIYISA